MGFQLALPDHTWDFLKATLKPCAQIEAVNSHRNIFMATTIRVNDPPIHQLKGAIGPMNTEDALNCTPTYRVLSPAQIEALHAATTTLLETVGVRVMDPDAVAMLIEAGCREDADGRVRIPAGLVQEAIDSAPSSVTVYNRLGEPAMVLEGRRTYFGAGTDLIKTWDIDTGKLRASTLQDVRNSAKIADALADIDFIASYALPSDSPANMSYIDSFKVQLENSVKPIFYTAAGLEDIALINEMAAAVVGGTEVLKEKPIHIHYAEPLSPLTHTAGAIRKLFFCADNRVPVTYTPGMMSGATAPVTLAGAITLGNAEALSGLVLHQLRAKGAPIISGFGMSTFDMRTSACIYACPEYRLAISACADLYHHYRIPMWGTAGVSDAHLPDQQAGMEWTASLLTAALDGANLIHDVAYLGQGLIGHPAALVMCAEIISYVRRVARGFSISADHIGLEMIREVGPGGAYIETDHTFEYFKKEHWLPDQCVRDTLAAWQEKGRKTWGERCTQKAATILETHQPPPLTESVRLALEKIRQRASAALQNIQFEA